MPRISITRVKTPIQSLDSDSDMSSFYDDDSLDPGNEFNRIGSKDFLRSKTVSDFLIHNTSYPDPSCNPRLKRDELLKCRKVKISSTDSQLLGFEKIDIHYIKKFLKHEGRKDNLNFDVSSNKVLVVDDVESQRDILESFIKTTKSSSDFARDGYGAIKMFESYASQGFIYSVIFMDIIMPHLDGLKATQKIREIEKKFGYPRTFICGLSGDRDAKHKAEEAGMDNFLIKPVSYSLIKEIMESRMRITDED